MALARSLVLLLAAATASNAVGTQPDYRVTRRTDGAVIPRDYPRRILDPRAEDVAPDGYAPGEIMCPSDKPKIRSGDDLSPEEKEWLPKRRNATVQPIRDFLKRVAIPDFDSDKYLANAHNSTRALPNIGLAISGGGYRAMLTGAGALAAWDIRSDNSECDGCLGGLLQSATYLSGLSGGSWLVGSLYANNFTSVQASVQDPVIWQFDKSILQGPDQYSLLGYYQRIFAAVGDKADAGYNTTITDYWGRMLSYQLINATDGGPGFTFSSIADDEQFSRGNAPLPILVSDGRNPGERIISLNSTVFEFNPWELGSSDPTVNGYVPLKYVGSKFENGSLVNETECVAGFDNAAFVMGTSSSLFNQFVLYLNDSSSGYVPNDVPHFAIDALSDILSHLSHEEEDIADWAPNPFYGWQPKTNAAAKNHTLTLVDGGEDLQNVPYHPHLVRGRNVDVVFSIDSSADTDTTWPDGASAVATYERSLESIANGTGFPVVPGQSTFLNLGLNTRPTFFGCNADNISAPSPLIVYIPNYPYLYASNMTTITLDFSNDERDAIVQNGWAVATQMNSTRDKQWSQCVGCAMLQRSFARTQATVPDTCQQCFTRYCWNGTVDDRKPAPYDPAFYSEPLDVNDNGARSLGPSWAGSLVVGFAGLMLAL